MQIVWSFSHKDHIVLVMKFVDARKEIIIRYKKTAQAGETVPQLFRFLKFLLHGG